MKLVLDKEKSGLEGITLYISFRNLLRGIFGGNAKAWELYIDRKHTDTFSEQQRYFILVKTDRG